MSYSASPLDIMVRKLATRVALNDQDRAAILSLPHIVKTWPRASHIVREGEPPQKYCAMIQSGFAFHQKNTVQGSRQIVSLQLAGDFLDLQNLFLDLSDHNVQAMTALETVGIEREALQQLTLQNPVIGKAMWIEALVDASIYREWVTNVGRRDARSRIAHVLCEFALRMRIAGLGTEKRFELPMTQEQLADMVGLTPVHVNRTLKSLVADGIVHRDRRFIGFSNWNQISALADFNALYLHLSPSSPE
jgi:CRP-like cAMP-binding protein